MVTGPPYRGRVDLAPIPSAPLASAGLEEFLATLDEDQQAAVAAPAGPVMVTAGPGSGKTRVLAARVAHRVASGSDPLRTTAVTFTRRAAGELRSRLGSLGLTEVRVTTLHGLGRQLLERHWADRGRPRRVVRDAGLLIAQVADDVNVEPAALQAELEWAAALGLEPESYPKVVAEVQRRAPVAAALVAEAARRLELVKRHRRVADFGDLLRLAREALAADPSFAEAARWRHSHLLVDEAQDLSPAQWGLLEMLAEPAHDVFAVGDASQAIYGFGGADPKLLSQWAERVGARSFTLRRNYRCPRPVIEAAAAVLGRPPSSPVGPRDGGVCVVEAANVEQEASWVATAVREALREGLRPSEVAVLARTNAALEAPGAALHQAGVPVRRRLRLLDQPAVRFALGHLGRRAPGLPAPAVCRELEELAASSSGVDDADEEAWGALRALADEWAAESPAGRLADFEPWLKAALGGHEGEPAGRRRGVELVTFHRAKGLEWRRVFVVGVHDGLVPLSSAGDLDEERRLLFVALTRASEWVVCTWARRLPHGEGRLSPFLEAVEARPPRPADIGPHASAERIADLRRQAEALRAHAAYQPLKVPAARSA